MVGADMATVEQVMGHASAAATAAYLHMDLTLPREAYTRLGQLLAPRAIEAQEASAIESQAVGE